MVRTPAQNLLIQAVSTVVGERPKYSDLRAEGRVFRWVNLTDKPDKDLRRSVKRLKGVVVRCYKAENDTYSLVIHTPDELRITPRLMEIVTASV